jgi:integrase
MPRKRKRKNKHKGIYQRKEGGIYWIRYAGLDGKIKYESTGSTKFEDAQDLLLKRKYAIKDGKQPELKKIANYTFNELVGKYQDWINGRQRSAKIKAYIINSSGSGLQKKHRKSIPLIEAFGSLPLRRFNTVLVEQLQTDLMNRGLKNSSCNKVLNILKAMFTKAVEWDMVESEVLKRVRKVKLLRDDSKRLRYLSKEECQNLVNACDPHLKPIVITALNTGMRKGEILNLKWDNVDLKHGFILLDVTKNGERREIPINRTLEAAFLNKSIIRRLDVPYVFYDPVTGKPYQDITHSFKSACRRAKILDLHPHDLRHTFASQLIMASVDITTVKELLGHKDIKMTLRYAHLAPSHKVKAVDILDSTLNGQRSVVGERLLEANYTKTIQSVGVR